MAHLISHQKVFFLFLCFLVINCRKETYILRPVEDDRCFILLVFFLNREAGCPVLMLQWFIFFSPFSMRSWLWFNLLRFCCWIAVLRSRQFNNCHRIISVYETGRQRLLLICGCGDARHLRDRFRIMRRVAWSRRSRVAPCDPRRPSRQTGRRKKTSASVANEMSMHWENSGPNQSSLNPK